MAAPPQPPSGTPHAMPESDGVRRRPDDLAGIYIHVPFCERLCPYCDFAVTIARDIPHQAYAEAIVRELQARAWSLEGRQIATIYFGGGTPSLWDPRALEGVLEALAGHVAIAPGAEVTLEANPNQVTPASVACWRALGVNRLSIGCQSFEPRVLAALRRNHDAHMAARAVEAALDGMARTSIDLIYGCPQQTLEEWERDIARVEQLGALGHLSAYSLTVEPGTAFDLYRRRGRLAVPEDDLCADMAELLEERLLARGLVRYEVSNYARRGEESRHNTAYWTGAEYLGLGVGAHSLHIGAGKVERRANPRKLPEYLANPEAPDAVECLGARTHWLERLFLGCRTGMGLVQEHLWHQFGEALEARDLRRGDALLEEFVGDGLLTFEQGVWRATGRGLRMADLMAERIWTRLNG